jgi:UDP-N-acetylmuramate dehydrogenase
MMADSVQDSPDFMAGLKGRLLVNESMSRHTSWRTGGIADYFYTPADKADLIMLLRKLPQQIPVYWVGLGSNLLVRDGGFQGMIIRTSKGLDVARTAARNNLTGVEFLAGVPGSFGGALAMNAGAFGGETWDWVESIECVDRKGQCSELASSNVKFGYRNVNLPENNWILGGVLALEMAAGDYDGKDKIRSLLDQRGATQPIQSANAGSVFKNPPGDFAARLIEEAGLKGREIGDAAISSIHANFIVNKGNATSGDIERLIQMSRERVRQHCGIELDLEVRVIGSAE